MTLWTLDHPDFGPMRLFPTEGLWEGETPEGYELYIRCDFFDDDRLDPDCEALARRELGELERLKARIQDFLATAPLSRPAHLLGGEWKLVRLRFTNLDDGGIVHDEAACFAELHLRGDDHNVWVVRVEDGVPVALTGR